MGRKLPSAAIAAIAVLSFNLSCVCRPQFGAKKVTVILLVSLPLLQCASSIFGPKVQKSSEVSMHELENNLDFSVKSFENAFYYMKRR